LYKKQEKEGEKQEKQKFCNLGDPFETSKSIKKSILHFDYNFCIILFEYPFLVLKTDLESVEKCEKDKSFGDSKRLEEKLEQKEKMINQLSQYQKELF